MKIVSRTCLISRAEVHIEANLIQAQNFLELQVENASVHSQWQERTRYFAHQTLGASAMVLHLHSLGMTKKRLILEVVSG